MKSAKFKEDSQAVLSYQLHLLAVKNHLGKSPTGEMKQPPKPEPEPAVVARARREARFYRRLALLARVFPLAIGLACVFILWDSQRRAGARPAILSVAQRLPRPAGALPPGAIDESFLRSATPRRKPISIGDPATVHLQSLLLDHASRRDAGAGAEGAPAMSTP